MTQTRTFDPHADAPPSRFGRSFPLHLFQVTEGDVIRWNDIWHTVQIVVRTPDAPNPINQVTLHTNFGKITGQEQTQALVVPKAAVIR